MFGIRALIFLLGIAFVVWMLFRLGRAPSARKPASKPVDDMVRCARCGVFVPKHEAIREGDRHYCCSRHRDEDH